MVRKYIKRDSLGRRTDRVKKREVDQMLRLRAQGLTNAEIAARLNRRPETIKRHLDYREIQAGLKPYEETPHNRLIGLALQKALEEHLDEIRSLIEQWKNNLNAPLIFQVYLDASHSMSVIEGNPLFGCLKKHLPFGSLWQDYSIWKNRVDDYLKCCKRLIREIKEEGKNWQNVIRIANGFHEPILRRLSDIALGNEEREHCIKAVISYESMGAERHLADHGMLIVDDIEVLEANEPLTYKRQYILASDHFSHSVEASNLITLFKELKDLETKILGFLQQTQLRRDYIMYTCNLCPGQPRLISASPYPQNHSPYMPYRT
jgi:hypothetical protein